MCRYVISNACSKEISYKQKGTDVTFYLGIGKHDHLHWTDTTRYVSWIVCIVPLFWTKCSCLFPVAKKVAFSLLNT